MLRKQKQFNSVILYNQAYVHAHARTSTWWCQISSAMENIWQYLLNRKRKFLKFGKTKDKHKVNYSSKYQDATILETKKIYFSRYIGF